MEENHFPNKALNPKEAVYSVYVSGSDGIWIAHLLQVLFPGLHNRLK